MKIICISDTHGQHENLIVPNGDMLIHAGDITSTGDKEDLVKFNNWLGNLPHKYKIVIAGNHDFYCESHPEETKEILSNAIYLNGSGVSIEGFNIWGSPISPTFHHWAFMKNRGEEIRRYWQIIPENTDILITHCPPFGILDKTDSGKKEGCEDLLAIVQEKIKPRLHIFGHIHEAYGQVQIFDTQYINASVVGLNSFVGKSELMKWLFKKAVSGYQIIKFIRKKIFKTPVEKLTPKSLAGFSWRVVNPAIVIDL